MKNPPTLFLDIETAPILSHVWSLWSEAKSQKMVIRDWHMLCWCAKFEGSREILWSANNTSGDPLDDAQACRDLAPILSEADIVVAHNGIKFDLPRINSRFLANKIRPPSPYKIVDTLRIARRKFAFSSNRLGDLGQALGLGGKVATGGFDLWLGCLDGDDKSWAKMVRYCKRDVVLLEKVYKKIAPYADGLPNRAAYTDEDCCSRCGSNRLSRQGFQHTAAGRYQRYVCKSCGGWSRSAKMDRKSSRIRPAVS